MLIYRSVSIFSYHTAGTIDTAVIIKKIFKKLNQVFLVKGNFDGDNMALDIFKRGIDTVSA
jgi:hypothetical protein